jgi:hypothetical protein
VLRKLHKPSRDNFVLPKRHDSGENRADSCACASGKVHTSVGTGLVSPVPDCNLAPNLALHH